MIQRIENPDQIKMDPFIFKVSQAYDPGTKNIPDGGPAVYIKRLTGLTPKKTGIVWDKVAFDIMTPHLLRAPQIDKTPLNEPLPWKCPEELKPIEKTCTTNFQDVQNGVHAPTWGVVQ